MFEYIKKLVSRKKETGTFMVRIKETANSNFAGQTGKPVKYDPDGYVLMEIETRLRGPIRGMFKLEELELNEDGLEQLTKLATAAKGSEWSC